MVCLCIQLFSRLRREPRKIIIIIRGLIFRLRSRHSSNYSNSFAAGGPRRYDHSLFIRFHSSCVVLLHVLYSLLRFKHTLLYI